MRPSCASSWRAGAEPNDNDSLYHSVDPPDSACTRLLLEHGARVTETNALWHALDYDRLEPVRLLLEHGGDPNESPEWPALHHAVTRGRGPAFISLLAEHGADPAARDRHGRTAFQHAVRRGRDDLAEALRALGSPTGLDAADRALAAVSRGASAPAITLDRDARDVLIELAMRDGDGLARVVAAVGANFSAQWGGGPRGTLLHQAAWFGRADFVDYLLRAGADPDARAETEYDTPARLVCRRIPLQPEPPERQLLLARRRLGRQSRHCSSTRARASSGGSPRWRSRRSRTGSRGAEVCSHRLRAIVVLARFDALSPRGPTTRGALACRCST